VCAKYIDAAMERLSTKGPADERDLSLLERVLASEPDRSTACIFALDLILVGIDTVSHAPPKCLYSENPQIHT
jgi:hypothetical protein